MPLDVYWRQANAQAEQAVNVFPPAAAVAPFTGIETLFPFIQHPTPLQKAVLELDISQPDRCCLSLKMLPEQAKRRRR